MSSFLLLMALAASGVSSPPAPAAADLDQDQAAITRAALDYAEGYYEGAAGRMARAVSPMLTKRGLVARPGVDPFLVQMNSEMLIDATRSGRGKLDPDKRHLAPKVLDVDGDIASAQIFTSGFNDYLQLVKRDGEWRLLSVLWHPPAKDAAGPADADRAAVAQTVKALVAGLAANDAAAVQGLLHPALAWRYLAPGSDGSLIIVDQNAESVAGAMKAGGKTPFTGDTRIEVLGVDFDIASAKVTTPAIPLYLHLAKQKGAWRVINVLGRVPAGPRGR